MTDAYELANGLDPNNATDRQTRVANGYTHLENYLNGFGHLGYFPGMRESMPKASVRKCTPRRSNSSIS